jgi:pseudaminic acid synthase
MADALANALLSANIRITGYKEQYEMKLKEYLEQGKTYIIAEMSGNHGGSLEKALEIVRAAAEAGADCLKTQTYTADTLTIPARTEPFLLRSGLWDREYLYDLYEKAYTPWDWMPKIKEEAERLGMDFLSTPFDETAVEFLEGIGEEFYKIASFELVDIPLIREVARTGRPIIMSCGMGSEAEIREAVDTVFATGNRDLVLLKCCSAYPTDYQAMHLSTITDMRDQFGVPVGLSDHSEGTTADVAAVALGAAVIEKHFCISREDNTVDSAFSLSKEEFAQMVADVRNTEKALGKNLPNKGVFYGPAPEEAQSYSLRRSLFAVKDIAKGEEFTKENVRSIRPSGGLHPRYLMQLTGDGKGSAMRAARDIPFGTALTREDVAGELKG